MRRSTLAAMTMVALALAGCDRLPFFGGGEEDAAPPALQVAVPDTTQPAEQTPQQTEAPPAEVVETPPPQQQPTEPARTMVDEPWTPSRSGTVDPGMSRAEVVAVWGEPAVERSLAGWLYLHYRNGCEISCGTSDVVMFQGGQVVDAIVRGPGHTYSGVSSSPPGRVGVFTPPTI
jgi:hypothetical protein